MTSPPTSSRKILPTVLLGLLVIAVIAGLLIYFTVEPRARKLLAAELATVRAAGEPLRVEDLHPEAVPPEENAAPHYVEAAGLLAELRKRHGSDAPGDVLDAFDPSDESNLTAVRILLDSGEGIVTAVGEAARKPGCRFEGELLIDSLSGSLDVLTFRGLAEFLALDARVAILDGKGERAVDDLVAILRMGDAVASEGFLISYLSRLAIRNVAGDVLHGLLGSGGLDAAQLARLAEAVGRSAGDDPLIRCLMGERCYGLRALQVPGSLLRGEEPAPGEVRAGFTTARRWLHTTAFLESMKEVIALAGKPFHEAAPRIAQLQDAATDRSVIGKAMAIALANDLGIGSTLEVVRTAAVDRARWRTLAVALQIAAARATGEAAAGTPGKLPIDPFNGKPVIVLEKETGTVVYSVGPDGRDDGGEVGAPGSGAKDAGWVIVRAGGPEGEKTPGESAEESAGE